MCTRLWEVVGVLATRTDLQSGCDPWAFLAISARRALFTASGVLKASATSGSSTTTFEPSLNRRTYFPRSPRLKSYSSRISLFGLSALVGSLLPPGCQASADQLESISAFGEYHHDESPSVGLSN